MHAAEALEVRPLRVSSPLKGKGKGLCVCVCVCVGWPFRGFPLAPYLVSFPCFLLVSLHPLVSSGSMAKYQERPRGKAIVADGYSVTAEGSCFSVFEYAFASFVPLISAGRPLERKNVKKPLAEQTPGTHTGCT